MAYFLLLRSTRLFLTYSVFVLECSLAPAVWLAAQRIQITCRENYNFTLGEEDSREGKFDHAKVTLGFRLGS